MNKPVAAKPMSELHKWVASMVTVGVVLWGSMAYFITAEDAKLKLAMESRVNQLEQQQLVTLKINALVIEIDRKLAVFEVIVGQQQRLVTEVRDIQQDVTRLKTVIKGKKNASTITGFEDIGT